MPMRTPVNLIDVSTGLFATIAILGASNDRHKFGNKGVRAYQADGWRVLPVKVGRETRAWVAIQREGASI